MARLQTAEIGGSADLPDSGVSRCVSGRSPRRHGPRWPGPMFRHFGIRVVPMLVWFLLVLVFVIPPVSTTKGPDGARRCTADLAATPPGTNSWPDAVVMAPRYLQWFFATSRFHCLLSFQFAVAASPCNSPRLRVDDANTKLLISSRSMRICFRWPVPWHWSIACSAATAPSPAMERAECRTRRRARAESFRVPAAHRTIDESAITDIVVGGERPGFGRRSVRTHCRCP